MNNYSLKKNLVLIVFIIILSSCTMDDESDAFPGSILSAKYTVFAWNDLGMHCLNPTYDKLVILPPYNTVWVQIIERGMPPKVVTSGLTVEYGMIANTSSSDKRSYGQFWDNAGTLFDAAGLLEDTGLNLEDPGVHNGLTGTMLVKGDHFQVDGIPVVPVDDSGNWNPYQQIEITVKDLDNTIVATTRAMVPTSDEINCARCHGDGGIDSAFDEILIYHDASHTTSLRLPENQPVLCASCHGSPALGSPDSGTANMYLSEAIHGYHSGRGASCYDCHPGSITECSRSLEHTGSDGNCISCHGDMGDVSGSIAVDGRIPWAEEPGCGSCHVATSTPTRTLVDASLTSTIWEVDTGDELYRNASGHGGVSCAACHGSPHAMFPSSEINDNYQAKQYQGKAMSISSCAVCHSDSHGDGFYEFYEEHGEGSEGETSACKVCHTGFSLGASSSDAPHKFQWRSR